MRAWFYDTWGFRALVNRSDAGRDVAVEADRWRESHGIVVVTTDYVLDETLTALQRRPGPDAAIRFADEIDCLVDGGELTLVHVDPTRRRAALEVFRRRARDVPRLSFTDCTTFAVMAELGVEVAFTADRHFHRAGDGIRPLFDVVDGVVRWSPPEA